jgi:hypothetical protein
MHGLAKLAHEAEAAERRANAYRSLIKVANDLGEEGVAEALALLQTSENGHDKTIQVAAEIIDDPTPSRPRGREAIRLIVHQRPGLWKLADLRAEMKQRGWFTSPKAVEVAVMRLCESGEAERRGKGLYEFGVPSREEAEAA